jgi:hypothetical protein
MVEHLPSLYKALDLICTTDEGTKKKLESEERSHKKKEGTGRESPICMRTPPQSLADL